jgi:DNA-binding SARP family transcriptional activator
MAVESTLLSQKQVPLLTLAVSKLGPNIFSHPVWVRFSDKDKVIPRETIHELFGEAEQLQRDHPGDACQVLLICAVYQNYAGQKTSALTTLQKALDLAQRSGLSQEVLWAIWGACAICVQQGNYEQAAIHFGRLQAVLNEQNEWILADYIDVVSQFFLVATAGGTEKHFTSGQNQEFGTLLTFTFDWLHRWGFSTQAESCVSLDQQIVSAPSQRFVTQPFDSEQRHQGPWQTLKLIFQGELRFHWVRSHSPCTESQSSLWGSILRSLRAYFSGRKIHDQMIEADPEILNLSTLPKGPDNSLPGSSSPEQQTELADKPIHIDHVVQQTTTAIPVSVHMLGRFVISSQNVALMLPASRSLSLLKYLMLNHKQTIPREVLMDVFWPDAEPVTARNNLNVAIHAIRRALRTGIDLPVILYRDGAYSVAPDLQVWLDVEEFERLVSAGQRLESRNQSAAVSEYEAAISLYQGDFLQENPYEGWTALTRESLRMAYLNALDSLSRIYFSQERYAACIMACQRLLDRDRCREDAHCMLMRCYNQQGQDHMALRQYQACVEALRLELDVLPAPTTTQLVQQIRQHSRV